MTRRLKGVPARLAAAPHRLRRRDVETRDDRRAQAKPWRKWYSLARWSRLRRRVLERQMYQCAQTGVMLVAGRDAPNAAVVDHIQPHRGDPALFWDEDNLQAVAKSWHDAEKQKQESAGRA